MKAIFKPTGYEFTINDKFFIEVIFLNGESKFMASFSDSDDAIDFAKLKLERGNVRGVMVFSRDAQIFSEWK